jgi:carboxypeptidase PM20D1
MRKVLSIVLVGVAVLVAVLVVRILLLESSQIDVTAVETISVERKPAVDRLAQVIRHRTISNQDPADFDPLPFLGLHASLQTLFPRVHQRLEREFVSDYSLLYTWQGSDPSLQPMLLLAHTDVVPIEPGTEGDWDHPPFGGVVSEGVLWGRGTLDNKGNLVAELEAVEGLLARGFRPRRTIYLAFGHDEEVGGHLGAVVTAELLHARGVRFAFVVDEGMAVTERLVPEVDVPVAAIGLAEKGFLSLKLTATAQGGHSSNPPSTTAIGALARAIANLESEQMPRRIAGPIALSLDALAPEMGFVPRLLVANRWVFEGLLLRFLEGVPAANSMVRTTTAPTILHGGVKENVLPTEAFGIVNFRILPGDTLDSVVAHVRRVIGDSTVDVRPAGRTRRDPSPVSDVDALGFEVIHQSIREVFPNTLVVPGLVLGGTDSRHYAGVSDQVYRFGPIRINPENLDTGHGTNERISVDNYVEMIKFYGQLIRNAAG